ncbi:branched-chain amino acid transaminase [Wenzhouxiangella sp. AB-CW3]|jgi:branched-chain amino acid aminotransferase|uniref:branched-chain amino acid transaminase n=1 Tax=Wenzhouxiangella sp. AB-CW3 TaxID=2771012 RepID=UPI00168A72A0|nr:branched-chain amino acid transaminase [Wenzhouxiangella sp. AB-CW3]QOC22068.1 branched-chain amino acid transaminase [Wenzhouxiangella sp. AB-CW3]
MAIQASKYIWKNGELLPWQEATVHVLSHAIHYGSSVFEGIRVYATPEGPAAFRLQEHIDRLFDSARIHRVPMPFDRDALLKACEQVVVENGLDSAYLRPIVFRGYGGLGVVPGEDVETEVVVAAVSWGRYLGEEAMEHGVDVAVTSWQRPAPNTVPTLAKAGGNYISGSLISSEAKRHGYGEGIALSHDGLVSEGAGENLFLVRNGVLYTPPVAASILGGITRDTVMHMAAELDIEVRELAMPREMLYLADEAFFTGTAAEITPIRSIDGITVRAGGRGPITRQFQDRFFGLFDGSTADRHGWLTHFSRPMNEDQEIPHVANAV